MSSSVISGQPEKSLSQYVNLFNQVLVECLPCAMLGARDAAVSQTDMVPAPQELVL